MTPDEVKEYYGNGYRFHKQTGMSQATFLNWKRQGHIPVQSQARLQQLTKGELKASWDLPER